MIYHNTSSLELEVTRYARDGFERITKCSSEDYKRVAYELYTDLDGYISEMEYAPMESLDDDIVSCADWLEDENKSRKK